MKGLPFALCIQTLLFCSLLVSVSAASDELEPRPEPGSAVAGGVLQASSGLAGGLAEGPHVDRSLAKEALGSGLPNDSQLSEARSDEGENQLGNEASKASSLPKGNPKAGQEIPTGGQPILPTQPGRTEEGSLSRPVHGEVPTDIVVAKEQGHQTQDVESRESGTEMEESRVSPGRDPAETNKGRDASLGSGPQVQETSSGRTQERQQKEHNADSHSGSSGTASNQDGTDSQNHPSTTQETSTTPSQTSVDTTASDGTPVNSTQEGIKNIEANGTESPDTTTNTSENINTDTPNTTSNNEEPPTIPSPVANAEINTIASAVQTNKTNVDSSISSVWMRTAAPLLIVVVVLFSVTV
ncbi:uncharacterized protein TM35_000551190 [Trypanosoma theileri]|uniref:Mucin-associated surface protein (MASP) n=1 Tax=Trypanosoma theileri TaxID=67003 RepID=A0A1X0NID4_9TRYP|nr:uncharacterized protein TM35_000551190 [Trypanosoma theileri]ORC83850.1 hypothetical protein TM35_000551190 [Trypanosoma theileri]